MRVETCEPPNSPVPELQNTQEFKDNLENFCHGFIRKVNGFKSYHAIK